MHCSWLSEDGAVWVSGSNKYGQLGFGDYKQRDHPCCVPNLPPVLSVQSGGYATLCLDKNGTLWSFGRNVYGQLGLGSTNNCSSPNPIPGIPPVCSFSIFNMHVACLCEDNSVWTFGKNTSGQLGLGNRNNQSTPMRLSPSYFPNEIMSISCGYNHTLFLTSKGQVLACGNNGKGQLGLSDSGNRSIPTLIPNTNTFIQVDCGNNLSCMVDSSHRLWVCGSHKGIQVTPLCIPSVGSIKNISLGYSHILCINHSGELWGWGDPTYGELGNGSTEPLLSPILLKQNITESVCISHSSFIREASGEVFCCGENTKGQLGIGNTNNQLSFYPFNEDQFTIKFPCKRRKKREEILGALLCREDFEEFLEIEKMVHETEEKINGEEEEGRRKIRAVGWERKVDDLKGKAQTIFLAGAAMQESFTKKTNRIQIVKEKIEYYKSTLADLEEELVEVQIQADQLAMILADDFTAHPKMLIEKASSYAEQEVCMNEELAGLLERKKMCELSTCELGVVLWKMDLSHVYPIIEEKGFDGELLCSLNNREMAALFHLTKQEAYTMQYHIELMQCPGYNLYDPENVECPVCFHDTPRQTIELMREHRIPIPPEVIKNGCWTTPQIIYSDAIEDFQLSPVDQVSFIKALSVLKKCHKEHLASLY